MTSDGGTLQRIQELAQRGEVRISEHGYDELAEDELYVDELVVGLGEAVLIEDYPVYGKGPCVLVLQRDAQGKPVHVVWGIPKNLTAPAVLVTAYRPDTRRWT